MAAKPVAPAAPAALVIETATVPTTSRVSTKMPNPFEGRFPTAAATADTPAAAISVTLASGTEAERKDLEKIVKQAQEAGRAVDTTTRVHREASKDGKSTCLTFWSVEKITRPRKPVAVDSPEAVQQASDAQTVGEDSPASA